MIGCIELKARSRMLPGANSVAAALPGFGSGKKILDTPRIDVPIPPFARWVIRPLDGIEHVAFLRCHPFPCRPLQRGSERGIG
jgi:hypothetical protein